VRSRSLRWRLTVWYTAAVGALLVVLGAAAVVLLDRALRANVDTSLQSVTRTVARTARESAGLGANLEAQLEMMLGPRLALRFLQLLDPLGRPDPRLARRGAGLPLSPVALDNARAGVETFETIHIDGRAVRLLTRPVVEGGRVVQLVQAAAPLEAVEEARERFLLVLLGLAPLALAGVAAGAWRLTGRALAPVDAMAGAARRITGENLSLRIDARESDDELGRLAAVLNDMLARSSAPSLPRASSAPTRRTSCARRSPFSRARSASRSGARRRPRSTAPPSRAAGRRSTVSPRSSRTCCSSRAPKRGPSTGPPAPSTWGSCSTRPSPRSARSRSGKASSWRSARARRRRWGAASRCSSGSS